MKHLHECTAAYIYSTQQKELDNLLLRLKVDVLARPTGIKQRAELLSVAHRVGRKTVYLWKIVTIGSAFHNFPLLASTSFPTQSSTSLPPPLNHPTLPLSIIPPSPSPPSSTSPSPSLPPSPLSPSLPFLYSFTPPSPSIPSSILPSIPPLHPSPLSIQIHPPLP
jgi:hypothetical protein